MRIIIISVIVLLILYILLSYLFTDRKVIQSSILRSNANETNKEISSKNIPYKPGITDFTMSFWLYIDKYGDSGTPNNIINKNHDDNNNLFKIVGRKDKNDIDFYIKTIDNAAGGEIPRLTLSNVYLQKWMNIIMTVETRNLDIYLDGKLEETLVLDSLPNENMNEQECNFEIFKDMDSGSESQMKISNVQYLTRNIAPREAWSIYKEGYKNIGLMGYLTGMLSGYQINFSFRKNGDEITKFNIGG